MTGPAEHAEARQRLAAFLRGETGERLFRQPTGHPSSPTGFCFCDRGVLAMVWFCLKAGLLQLLLQLPFAGPKLWFLRRLGARIGRNVHLAPRAWIDPTFPELITIEDGVFVGMDARLLTHEYRIDEFRAGRIVLRRGCFVGGFAILACGVEVGEGATVAAGAVVGRDVPPGCTAIGNPARIVARGAAAEITVPEPPEAKA
ncbi:MAG: acyltransferase [Planctomycetes bacterium]|nr:acyltransferase [Planctomycetota bacterium]